MDGNEEGDMQAGYSISLGEIVPAADAEYDDCAKFQITCPACREAVFKGLRTTPREIHYFSHYRAVDDAALCELRVAQLSKDSGIVDGFQSHEQSLKKFLANFRDNIISGYERASGVNLRRQAMKIYIQPYLDDIADRAFREICSLIWREDNPRNYAAGITGLAKISATRSPFWHRRAASYVLDALRHLDTEQASTNRRLLIALGFASWPRRHDDFNDWSENTSGFELVQAISDVKPEKVVRRIVSLRMTQDDNVELVEEQKRECSRMSLQELTHEKKRLEVALKRLNVKNTEAAADLAGLHLLIPTITLLALGYDN